MQTSKCHPSDTLLGVVTFQYGGGTPGSALSDRRHEAAWRSCPQVPEEEDVGEGVRRLGFGPQCACVDYELKCAPKIFKFADSTAGTKRA